MLLADEAIRLGLATSIVGDTYTSDSALHIYNNAIDIATLTQKILNELPPSLHERPLLSDLLDDAIRRTTT